MHENYKVMMVYYYHSRYALYKSLFLSLGLPRGQSPEGLKPQINDLIVCKETVHVIDEVMMVYYYHSWYVIFKSLFFFCLSPL
jgi:hypothetical protein